MNLSDYRTCRDLPTLTKTEIIDGKEKKAYHMGCWFPHPITKEGREHYLNEFQDILQKKGKNNKLFKIREQVSKILLIQVIDANYFFTKIRVRLVVTKSH